MRLTVVERSRLELAMHCRRRRMEGEAMASCIRIKVRSLKYGGAINRRTAYKIVCM